MKLYATCLILCVSFCITLLGEYIYIYIEGLEGNDRKYSCFDDYIKLLFELETFYSVLQFFHVVSEF